MVLETLILSHILPPFIFLASLVLGLVLVLRGLDLFRFYVVLWGIFIGALLGIILGGKIASLAGGIDSIFASGVIGGLFLATVGGVIAWPLQKAFVFIISGSLVGSLVIALTALTGAPQQAWLPIGIVIFVLAGIASVALYKHIIVVVLALGGAQAIFSAIYLPRPGWIDVESLTGLKYYWQLVCDTSGQNIIPLLFTVILFVPFAYYFQKIKAIKPDDDRMQRAGKWRFRRVTYLYARFCLYIYAVLFIATNYLRDYLDGFGGTEYPEYSFDSYSLFGINIISLPILIFLTFWFTSWLNKKGYKYSFIPNHSLTKYLYFTVFVLAVIPLITLYMELLTSSNYLFRRWESSFLWHGVPYGYYHLFFFASPAIIVVKWIFSLFIFPGAVYLACLREAPEQEEIQSLIDHTTQTPTTDAVQKPAEDTEQIPSEE